MIVVDIIAAVLAFAAIGYLVYTLAAPERF